MSASRSSVFELYSHRSGDATDQKIRQHACPKQQWAAMRHTVLVPWHLCTMVSATKTANGVFVWTSPLCALGFMDALIPPSITVLGWSQPNSFHFVIVFLCGPELHC